MEMGFSNTEARHLPEEIADMYLEAWDELKGVKKPGGKLLKSKPK